MQQTLAEPAPFQARHGPARGDRDTVTLRACTLYLSEFGEGEWRERSVEKAERDKGVISASSRVAWGRKASWRRRK